jgi:hypothetical protein
MGELAATRGRAARHTRGRAAIRRWELTLSATQAGVGAALLRAPLIQRELAAGLFLHGAQQPAREAPGTIRQVGIGTRTEVIIAAVVQCLVRQLD